MPHTLAHTHTQYTHSRPMTNPNHKPLTCRRRQLLHGYGSETTWTWTWTGLWMGGWMWFPGCHLMTPVVWQPSRLSRLRSQPLVSTACKSAKCSSHIFTHSARNFPTTHTHAHTHSQSKCYAPLWHLPQMLMLGAILCWVDLRGCR